MVTIEHAFLIPAGIDKVFKYLSNPGNDASWQLSCKHSKLFDNTPRVGSKYELNLSFASRDLAFKGEVTHLVPNEFFAFQVLEGSFYYKGTYRFKPHPEGTWIEWVFEAEPGGFFGVFPDALLKKMVLAQFKKDLINLQALAQKGGTYEAVSKETNEIEKPVHETEKILHEIEKPPQKTHLVMEKYARWILRHRRIVLTLVMLLTIALAYLASGVKIIIDPSALAPNGHPYITSTKLIEKKFGSKYMVVIGITPKQGDIYQPQVLEKVKRITEEVDNAPGVVRSTLMSLAARQAKGITANSDGFDAKKLLPNSSVTENDVDHLKKLLALNPIYMNSVVSKDQKTAAILLELEESPEGFQKMMGPINKIVAAEQSKDMTISVGGNPVYLDKAEDYSKRINILFPIAVLVIGLLHFEAFRSKQGLILPLVTALLSVAWGMGMMGLFKQPMDIFNSPTPILILAIAAGHAVQLLKRYYEDFDRLIAQGMEPKAANSEAVVQSMVRVGPVMILAGGIAAAGFFSLLTFNIPTIRSFGIFTGIGIISTLVIEMTFIPALRSMLPPPSVVKVKRKGLPIWDWIPNRIGDAILSVRPRMMLMTAIAAVGVFLAIGASRIVIDNDSRNFFSRDLPMQQDDRFLNQSLGGTNSLYIMVDTKVRDGIENPEILKAIDNTEKFANSIPEVGKTISIVDYIKRMNQAMNADQPQAFQVPATKDVVAQYLLLYSMSGEPTDFDSYIDTTQRYAKITILMKTGSNHRIKEILESLKTYMAGQLGHKAVVSFGGDVTQTIALTETMVHGKLMNILQISFAVFFISALVFRSISAGLVVLTPLLFSILAIFGVMGWLDIPLNIPNSLISAMAVGIGADYAIYFLYRLREILREEGGDIKDAIRKTLSTAGKASLFVATAVAGGYGVLSLSQGFHVHQWLAMFIVIAMLFSVFATLIMVPTMILMLKPRFIFPSNKKNITVAQTVVTSLLLGTALTMSMPKTSHADEVQDIVNRSDDASKFLSSSASAKFVLTSKSGEQRVRLTKNMTKLAGNTQNNMRLTEFISPADVQGTTTLLIENAKGSDSMFVYLPALKKVRRLASANKGDAFIGTDFSYGDVLGYKLSDWKYTKLADGKFNGKDCYTIEATPINNTVKSDFGYSKRRMCILKDNFVTATIDIWDTAGKPLKHIEFTDIRPYGKVKPRWQAMKSMAKNLQTQHMTQVIVNDFVAEKTLSDKLFSPQSLEK